MAPDARSLPGPAREAEAEIAKLDRELSEIERLIGQARDESRRHEMRRTQADERLVAALADGPGGGADIREAIATLITATRKASLMDSQVEVLEGKQRTLARFRDRLQHYADLLAEMPEGTHPDGAEAPGAEEWVAVAPTSGQILEAQEMLRRDIARAMHDGPAQSLTNIALQTQIVERVLARNPALAVSEVNELLDMVRRTLEETKTFVFDVRPMVLDDLGLVPTLRRAAHDRGRQRDVPIDFDSRGQDRRLGTDLESSLFRVLDEAIIGFLAAKPARITVRLGWGESGLRAEVRSTRSDEEIAEAPPVETAAAPVAPEESPIDGQIPPALAAMILERRMAAARVTDAAAGAAAAAAGAGAAAAAEAAAAAGSLPAAAWKAIKARVSFGRISVELLDRGRLLVAEVPYPA
jgi:two-component system sensor histidine kinase DegS